MTIYINCRSQNTLHTDVLSAIKIQTYVSEVKIVESQKSPMRLSLLATCPTEIAVFLDEDIVLPRAAFLEDVKKYFDQNSEIQFLAGNYLSDKNASYLQKSYNWLTNLWIQPIDRTKLSTCNNAPGGFWAVKSDIAKLCDDWVEPTDWGGEDTRAIKHLQGKGVKIYSAPNLGVLHYPRHNLYWFLVRAYKQGKAKQKWNLSFSIHVQSVNKEIIKNLIYLPALLLHQSFVFLGILAELIKSNIAKPKPTSPEIK